MSCTQFRKFLDAYVDGELNAGPMLEVETHLDSCPSCGALRTLKQDMKINLAAISANIKAPAYLVAQISKLPSRARRRRIYTAIAAAPLAAAAALLLVLVVGGESETNTGAIAEVVNDVVKRHTRELPMEVAGTDTAKAATWFQGKVDFPVSAPRLKLRNASFQGARLSNVQRQQAAHLVYSLDGHRVTMMIFPSNEFSVTGGGNVISVGGRSVLTGRRNGYNVAIIKDGDMIYTLSSDLPVPRLAALLTDTAI